MYLTRIYKIQDVYKGNLNLKCSVYVAKFMYERRATLEHPRVPAYWISRGGPCNAIKLRLRSLGYDAI
jgi:hypothetical protein